MKRDVSSPTECSRLHNASYSDLEAESESSFTSATSSIARIRSICANFAERYPERLSAQGSFFDVIIELGDGDGIVVMTYLHIEGCRASCFEDLFVICFSFLKYSIKLFCIFSREEMVISSRHRRQDGLVSHKAESDDSQATMSSSNYFRYSRHAD